MEWQPLPDIYGRPWTWDLSDSNPSESSAWPVIQPKMDIHEDVAGNTMTAILELPGVKRKDITIEVVNSQLIVTGKSSVKKNRDGFFTTERRYGIYHRTLALPRGVQAEDVNAKLEDGLLTVTYPRVTPATE
ncbi:hypothetical protein ONZ45_g8227 [Pleurotus djamor]|nr:hypothetical protein ONZ45_g8227 [Pleurotus djamor]